MNNHSLEKFLDVLKHIQEQMSTNPDITSALDLSEQELDHFHKGVDLVGEAVHDTVIINKVSYKPGSQEEVCIGTEYLASALGNREFPIYHMGYGASEKEAFSDLVDKLIQETDGKVIFSL